MHIALKEFLVQITARATDTDLREPRLYRRGPRRNVVPPQKLEAIPTWQSHVGDRRLHLLPAHRLRYKRRRTTRDPMTNRIERLRPNHSPERIMIKTSRSVGDRAVGRLGLRRKI